MGFVKNLVNIKTLRSPVEMRIKDAEECKGWAKRQLCLMLEGSLKFFENEKMEGFIPHLDISQIVKNKKKGKDFQYAFEIHTKEYVYFIAVETEKCREKWIKEINTLLEKR